MKNKKDIISRSHPLWLAYILHRLSGIALALFLPIHFWVLSMAMTNLSEFDQFLAMSQIDIIKFAEFILVFLLAVHMFGGLRLMGMEWLSLGSHHKNLAAGAIAISFLIAILFFLKAI